MREVTEYINRQAEHHRKRDFAQEYLALLKKHGAEYGPAWFWVSAAPPGLA